METIFKIHNNTEYIKLLLICLHCLFAFYYIYFNDSIHVCYINNII